MSLMQSEAVVRRPQLRLRVDRAAQNVVAIGAGLGAPLKGRVQVESNALLRGERELLIHHGGEVYRLRHTRNDKLILTK